MHILAHYKTVHRHRKLVRKYCFRLGLYWQGLTHDLSKYSPIEFLAGARYFQGDHSPNDQQRRENGYSASWMHHKGRNRHHFEYWTDMNLLTKNYEPLPMPRKYLVEMIMDRRAACMTYQGKNYKDDSALIYFNRGLEKDKMHPQTREELRYILTMLAEKGEKETFAFLKEVLRGAAIPLDHPRI